MHLFGLGIMGWFESRSNEERGNFAGRVGERRQRQSFGNLEAHFRALRCVRVIVFPYPFVYNSWHRMHGFSQRERERASRCGNYLKIFRKCHVATNSSKTFRRHHYDHSRGKTCYLSLAYLAIIHPNLCVLLLRVRFVSHC